MALVLDYQKSLAESTSTSSTPADKVQVTQTLTSGKTYAFLWSCEVKNDNVGGNIGVLFRDKTGSVSLANMTMTPQDTTDYVLMGGVCVYVAVATASRNFAIQYTQNSSGTAAIRNARIVMLELDSADFAGALSTFDSTSSGTFQDRVSLNVNGAAAEPYLFIGAFGCNNGSAAASANLEARGLKTDGTTAVNVVTGLWGDSTGSPYAVQWVETLTGANVNAKLQYRSHNGSTAGVRHAALVAIRINSLGDTYVNTLSETDDGGTEATATDSETVSGGEVDTVSGDVLVIGTISYKGSSSTVSSKVDFVEGSTSIIESFHEDRSTGGDHISSLVAFISESANATETWKWRRQSETTGATTTVTFAAITVVGLTVDSGETFEESISGGLSLNKTLLTAATVVGAASATINLSQAAAAEYVANASISAGLTLAKTLTTDAVLGASVAPGITLAMALGPELVLEFSASFGAVLDSAVVAGTTFEGTIEDGLELDCSFVSANTFFGEITAAINLTYTPTGGIEIDLDISFAAAFDFTLFVGGTYNVSLEELILLEFTPGAELLISAEVAEELTLYYDPLAGTTFEVAAEAGLSLGYSLATTQEMTSSLTFALALAQASAAELIAEASATFATALSFVVARQLVISTTVTFSISNNMALHIGGTYNVTLPFSIALDTSLSPGLLINSSISSGLLLNSTGEIIDFDLLLEVSENLVLGLAVGYETWFTQAQSISTSFSTPDAEATTYSPKAGPSTPYALIDNCEDPEYPEHNV